jgi:hypothetical protein
MLTADRRPPSEGLNNEDCYRTNQSWNNPDWSIEKGEYPTEIIPKSWVSRGLPVGSSYLIKAAAGLALAHDGLDIFFKDEHPPGGA